MTDEKKISELTADELAAYANEGLAAKNRELLAELKKYKTTSVELSAELETAKSELMSIKLHGPVNNMLAQMFDLPSDIALACAEKFVKFELDGGKVIVRDRNGQRMMIKPDDKEQEREAAFDVQDLRYILSQTGELDKVLVMSRAQGTGKFVNPVPVVKNKSADISSQLGIK